MFTVTELATRAVRLDPVRLPLTAALLVRDDVRLDEVHVFNLPGAINLLLGSAGWDRATRVIQPKIWANHWTNARLSQFVSRPFAQKPRPFPVDIAPTLRIWKFPADLNACEIVHVVDDWVEPPFSRFAGLVPEILIALKVRLLILQVEPSSHEYALRLAKHIVEPGGPATTIVSGRTPGSLDRYFLGLYARIIHNEPLRVVARPDDAPDAPRVDLVLGPAGDEALQFTRWFNAIGSLINDLRTADQRVVETLADLDLTMLHAHQRERLQTRAREVLNAAQFNLDRVDSLHRNINWARESGGAIPLSELSEAVPYLEGALTTFAAARYHYPQLAAELAAEAQKLAGTAPRVLNANFAHPQTREFASPDKPLLVDAEYELLVDVGPRWSRVESLVTGNAAFPEKALPPSDDGYRIQVLFFSDDFPLWEITKEQPRHAHEPRHSDSQDFPPVDLPPLPDEEVFAFDGTFRRPVASGEIWVPAKSGRSFPIVNGKRSKFSGPIALRLRTPVKAETARGRLSLYFENNLLQSAAVSVHIGERKDLADANSIDVDYVLSGGFTDLTRYRARALAGGNYPVAVNITMNDDGAGSHRLVIVGSDELTVMRPYDPDDAKHVLGIARGKLKECFSLRNDQCVVEGQESAQRSALGPNNEKSLKQFRCDLFQLAWYGSDIFSHTFGAISNPHLIKYLSDLAAGLESRRVIQISRTTHAQYVYPWALMYDIPLPNRSIQGKLKWCKVVEEWGTGKDASRSGPPAKKCPYHNAPEHRQDILCPYGFWGFKHYIEQPINVVPQPKPGETPPPPPDAASTVKLSNPVGCGLGVTRDTQLDPQTLEAHVKRIKSLAACTPVDGADDWDDVQAMLAEPDVAYFICHGEYDQQSKKTYLSIGPRDGGANHRVYPDQLMQWARTQKNFWAARRPLVFINGCHTANLVPGEILNFVPTFANFGASAVIGTEISVRLPLAVEVAEKLLERVLQGEKVGVVMHDLRWELANKGNLLGLAYTPYCLSDLTFTR